MILIFMRVRTEEYRHRMELVTVEGGGNAKDVDAFPYAPAMPVIVTRKDLNVFSAEVMLCVCSVLHDG